MSGLVFETTAEENVYYDSYADYLDSVDMLREDAEESRVEYSTLTNKWDGLEYSSPTAEKIDTRIHGACGGCDVTGFLESGLCRHCVEEHWAKVTANQTPERAYTFEV